MSKLLASDLDGTMFYPKRLFRCIPKKNVKFLREWIDAGNKVVFVTSRSHNFTKRLETEVERPFDTINCASCQIYADGNLIRNDKMDNQSIKQILKEIEEKYHPLGILMTSKDYPCIIKKCVPGRFLLLLIYKLYWIFQFKYKEEYIMSNYLFDQELDHGDIYKIMLFFGIGKNKSKISIELNKKLTQEYPEIETSWVSFIIDITPKDCNKGLGLDYYVKSTGVDPHEVYVVGDSGNDLSMFDKYPEHSYAMKHAYPSVKKHAKYVISRVFKLDKYVLKGEQNEQH